jgi:hypothetical protein
VFDVAFQFEGALNVFFGHEQKVKVRYWTFVVCEVEVRKLFQNQILRDVWVVEAKPAIFIVVDFYGFFADSDFSSFQNEEIVFFEQDFVDFRVVELHERG